MSISTTQILHVLSHYGIEPLEDDYAETDLPGIGEIKEGETVYSTSLNEVFGPGDDDKMSILDRPSIDDERMWEWQEELKSLTEEEAKSPRRRRPPPHAPEPTCAWYCPIHFFGHGWGIYIRESCILSLALDIASFVHWPSVHLPPSQIERNLLRSAFYAYFMHEQFHHKVESLGLRLLVSTGSDRYRPYKTNVYRRTFV